MTNHTKLSCKRQAIQNNLVYRGAKVKLKYDDFCVHWDINVFLFVQKLTELSCQII